MGPGHGPGLWPGPEGPLGPLRALGPGLRLGALRLQTSCESEEDDAEFKTGGFFAAERRTPF